MRELLFWQALNEALREETRREDSVIVLGEDVAFFGGQFRVTEGLLAEFGPERVIDTPISENGFTGMAVGMALMGLRPVVEFMTFNFSLYAFDQIVNNIAKLRFMSGGSLKLPIVLRGPNGVGIQLASQHSQCIEPLLLNVPGIKVVCPSSPYDAKGLLKSAILDDNPVIFLEPISLTFKKGFVPKEEYYLPLNKAHLKREGKDVSIITYGRYVDLSLEVAKEFEREGVLVEVLDLVSLKPLDKESILKSAKKTKRVLVVQEPPLEYGPASEVLALIAEELEGVKVKRLGGKNLPIPYNKNLERACIPSKEEIINALLDLLI